MEILTAIIQLFTTNSPYILDCVLMLAVGYLLYERKEHVKIIKKEIDSISDAHTEYDKSIKELIKKYYDGNIELVHALDEIKIVLSTITRK